MAVLTKGPVGVVLNGAVLGLWVLLGQKLVPGDDIQSDAQGWWQKLKSTFALRRIFAAVRILHPVTAIAVVSLVALPWYFAVSYRTGGAFFSEFFLRHNLARFVAPMENHEGPIFYYVVAVCIGFFPWSLFLGSTLKQLFVRLRPRGQWDQAWLFVSCWIGVYFVFFSLATTKLPHYVLPIYPALALASGAFVRELLSRASAAEAQMLRMASIGLLVVGGILVVTLLVLVKLYLPGEAAIAVLGLVPIVGGAVCLWLVRRSHVRYGMGAFAATAVTFALVAFGFVQLRADRHQNTNVLVDAIRASTEEQTEIAGYLHFRPSWVFYAEQYIPAFDKTKQVQAFFENSKNPYLITTELGLARLEARHRLPADVVKVVELPNFLRKGNVILLARQNAKIKLAEYRGATRR
jgi:4-amino-4-deoxy-L-arabinose transferase-like glycosyltransferase